MAKFNSYYGIRHKPTGFFMPHPTGRNGNGSSFWEPTEQADEPRLIRSVHAAKCVITQWLRGHHNPEFDYEDGWKYTVGTDVKPMPHRKREDMEIVEIQIEIKGVV